LANIKSQIKRNRQNEALRLKNAQSKSSIRTASKNVIKAAESKSTPDELKNIYLKFVRIIDRAAGNRIVHKKTAARKKSRLAKRINTALKNPS
jgi:small subunit ribosomal protein S20